VSRARDVVEVVARALVDSPDAVTVTEAEHHGTVVVDVHVKEAELGRLIGRQGRTATAIRTLASAAVEADGLRANVEFRDEQGRR
jgi:predicted RNA-binding protein YlqC (UPF0109 family)